MTGICRGRIKIRNSSVISWSLNITKRLSPGKRSSGLLWKLYLVCVNFSCLGLSVTVPPEEATGGEGGGLGEGRKRERSGVRLPVWMVGRFFKYFMLIMRVSSAGVRLDFFIQHLVRLAFFAVLKAIGLIYTVSRKLNLKLVTVGFSFNKTKHLFLYGWTFRSFSQERNCLFIKLWQLSYMLYAIGILTVSTGYHKYSHRDLSWDYLNVTAL